MVQWPESAKVPAASDENCSSVANELANTIGVIIDMAERMQDWLVQSLKRDEFAEPDETVADIGIIREIGKYDVIKIMEMSAQVINVLVAKFLDAIQSCRRSHRPLISGGDMSISISVMARMHVAPQDMLA